MIRIKDVIKAVSLPAWLLVGVWQRGGEKENNRMSASLLVPPHSNPRRRRGNAEDGKLAGDQQRKTEQGETCKRWKTESDEEPEEQLPPHLHQHDHILQQMFV